MGRFAQLLNDFRVFPRIALLVLLWMGVDAYLWTKENIQAEDVQWFGNLVISAIIMGLFAYMNTGRNK